MLKGFSPIVTAPPHICFVPPTRLSVFETPSPMRAPLNQILGCVDLVLPRLIREFVKCLLSIPSRQMTAAWDAAYRSSSVCLLLAMLAMLAMMVRAAVAYH